MRNVQVPPRVEEDGDDMAALAHRELRSLVVVMIRFRFHLGTASNISTRGGFIMRKAARLASVAAMFVLPRAACAHVGWGIAVGPDKTIFVADVLATTVWRIRPTGGTSVLWHGAHSHGIALDRQGNVYGEDARFVGRKFVVTVWRVNPEGHYNALFNVVTDPPAENIVLT